MTLKARFTLIMLIPVFLDVVINNIVLLVSGLTEYVSYAFLTSSLLLAVILVPLARLYLFPPVRRLLDGNDTPKSRAHLNRLPALTTLVVSITVSLVYILNLIVLPALEDSWSNIAWPWDFVAVVAAEFAAVNAVFIYFLTTDFSTLVKRQLFETQGILIPAKGGSIRLKIGVVLVAASALPLVAIAQDYFLLDTGDLSETFLISTEQAVAIDIIFALVILAVAVAFLPRGFSRPIDILVKAVAQVAAGNLQAKAPITSNDEIGQLTSQFNDMVDGLRERDHIRETFGKFVNEDVAKRVLVDRGTAADVQTATIMFTDIERFTSIVEKLSPAETIEVLNEYLGVVVEPIRKHHGVVLNFIGDALFAVFNVPVEDPEHADNAIKAAIEIEERLKGRIFKYGVAFDTRIGINTGEVVAGTIGTADRLGYTVLGDEVNLAARLEQLNKDFGCKILVSAATRDATRGAFVFEDKGETSVRGRERPVRVYSVSF